MNLRTSYLGMRLRTPLVPSASPLSEGLDNIRRMEDAGAAALVLHSLFEEHISHESHQLHHHLTHGTHSFAESLNYFPEPSDLAIGPERYLNEIAAAKEAVAGTIPGKESCFDSRWIPRCGHTESRGLTFPA
jgi:dihydroorotate dehydrogenase (fumarate)